VSVKIKDNTPRLLINSQRVINLAVRFAMDDVEKFARPRTPYSGAIQSQGGKSLTGGGHLRNDTIKTVIGGKGKIVWGKRYAAAQEAGIINDKPIRNYTTPGTGKKYAENAIRKVDKNRDSYIKRAAAIL
jgi:hypothetical protein